MKKSLMLLCAVLLLSAQSYAKNKISRVEPSFWWAGMKNSSLQIMVYGENISELRPEIDYDGVILERTVQVKSPNYLFLYLSIDKNVTPGSFKINFTRIKEIRRKKKQILCETRA